MTIDEVLAQAKARFPTWRLVHLGDRRWMRTAGLECFCPLEAAYSDGLVPRPSLAGQRLGVTTSAIGEIMRAADDSADANTALRTKMLTVFGLTEAV